ncbi:MULTISPECIES: organomercurial lyase [Halorussus]|uniref:Organomercurial lyase n=2 Tax=Halobacteriales TaxID=2235 RepID=A0ABD5Q7U6_9EURY|nr:MULTISPECIES: organomercurial lyase [Halorussus]USZ78531.1 alkylmercury lyase family protein [Halorussus vallis]
MGTEPQTDDRIDLPPDFADHLAAVGNFETPPETMDDYWARFAEQLAASDQTIEPEDLYTENPTRHEVRVNDHIRYSPCILDALGAAVMEDQDPVTVRSVDPVTGTPVTFTVDDGTVDVTPEEAVITFGIAATIPELEDSDETIFSWMLQAETPSLTNTFCQYINAFESADTYEQWAAETDGETVPFQPAAVGTLVRRYVVLD